MSQGPTGRLPVGPFSLQAGSTRAETRGGSGPAVAVFDQLLSISLGRLLFSSQKEILLQFMDGNQSIFEFSLRLQFAAEGQMLDFKIFLMQQVMAD